MGKHVSAVDKYLCTKDYANTFEYDARLLFILLLVKGIDNAFENDAPLLYFFP